MDRQASLKQASPRQASIQQAISFLVAHQGPTGLWRDYLTLAGESSDWTTGYVAAQLTLAGAACDRLDAAARGLWGRQQPDGGWGYHCGVPSDADSTAYVLQFLGAYLPNHVTAQKAARFLSGNQDPDSGGVSAYRDAGPIRRYMDLSPAYTLRGWCQPHLCVTAAAGRAWAILGGKWRSPAEAAWHFVRQRQLPEGSWRSYWWSSPHYPSLQAVTLAAALPGVPGTGHAIHAAARWVVDTQGAGGGWSPGAGKPVSAFATALSLSILAFAGEQGPAMERGLRCLQQLQSPDGSWASHPTLRIPPTEVIEPADHADWRSEGLGTGVIVSDRRRIYTTATCLMALALIEGLSDRVGEWGMRSTQGACHELLGRPEESLRAQ